jgi:hypothetical protein
MRMPSHHHLRGPPTFAISTQHGTIFAYIFFLIFHGLLQIDLDRVSILLSTLSLVMIRRQQYKNTASATPTHLASPLSHAVRVTQRRSCKGSLLRSRRGRGRQDACCQKPPFSVHSPSPGLSIQRSSGGVLMGDPRNLKGQKV